MLLHGLDLELTGWFHPAWPDGRNAPTGADHTRSPAAGKLEAGAVPGSGEVS
jgi:hypothetical protein